MFNIILKILLPTKSILDAFINNKNLNLAIMKNKVTILKILILSFFIGSLQALNYIPGKLYVKVIDPTGGSQIESEDFWASINTSNTASDNTLEAYSVPQQGIFPSSYIISNGQNVIWDDIKFCSGVLIEGGGILQLNSNAELYMNTTAKIIVEPGGELIIRGAKITKSTFSALSDFWQGIEVRGNGSQSQITQNQGSVRVMDNAIIEYAECGIRAYGMDNGNPIANSGGGIVLATGGHFINNKTAIKINSYVYINAMGYPQNNESVIMNNNIEINNDYFSHTNDSPQGVILLAVKKIVISGNIFQNNSSNIDGIGVYVHNSDVQIGNQVVPNTFNGFNYGIKVLGTHDADKINVEDNVFTSCNTGIYISRILNATIIFNQFDIITNQTGIYIDECTFIAEENQFNSNYNPTIGNLSFGMVVNNTRGTDNEVYRNTFNQIKYAVLAENSNRFSFWARVGLTFRCNTFTSNAFDISVTGDPLYESSGIRSIQGSWQDRPDASAGNIFSRTGPIGIYTDLNNESNDFIYYYHPGQIVNLQPIYFSPTTIELFPNSEPNAQWTENSCPSRQNSGGSGGGIDEIKEIIELAEEQDRVLNASLQNLKDAGDTPVLESEVDNSIPSETMIIYDELIAVSPYVSETVVESVIDKEQVIPNALLRDVMVANPHSARNSDLVEAIDNRTLEMPNYMKAQILQAKSNLGAMDELRTQISYYKNKRSLALKNLMNRYLSDTINPEESYDSILVFLENESSIEAKYQLVSYYLESGSIQQANYTINNIENLFVLTSKEELEYTQILSCFPLRVQLQQSNYDYSSLTQDQYAFLEDLELNGIGKAKSFARNIRRHLGLSNYEEPYIIPSSNKSTVAEEKEQEILQSLKDFHYIKLVPNPAISYTTVEYILEETITNAILQITDLSGAVLLSQRIEEEQNQIILDVRNFKAGNYLLSLVADKKVLETVQLNVIK